MTLGDEGLGFGTYGMRKPLDPVHSRDIASWVHRNGGFPVNGMRVMNNREAGQFWRRCELRRR